MVFDGKQEGYIKGVSNPIVQQFHASNVEKNGSNISTFPHVKNL